MNQRKFKPILQDTDVNFENFEYYSTDPPVISITCPILLNPKTSATATSNHCASKCHKPIRQKQPSLNQM